ncbi:MAG: hypothetical protein K0R72_151 [Clostridia bacterium]|jgi:hypothetical protein|nr:hypothetical protein [Clostridia bacterium]
MLRVSSDSDLLYRKFQIFLYDKEISIKSNLNKDENYLFSIEKKFDKDIKQVIKDVFDILLINKKVYIYFVNNEYIISEKKYKKEKAKYIIKIKNHKKINNIMKEIDKIGQAYTGYKNSTKYDFQYKNWLIKEYDFEISKIANKIGYMQNNYTTDENRMFTNFYFVNMLLKVQIYKAERLELIIKELNRIFSIIFNDEIEINVDFYSSKYLNEVVLDLKEEKKYLNSKEVQEAVGIKSL